MSDSLNERAWRTLFQRHRILDKIERNGVFYISANQIKAEREPRLMAKSSILKAHYFGLDTCTAISPTLGKYRLNL